MRKLTAEGTSPKIIHRALLWGSSVLWRVLSRLRRESTLVGRSSQLPGSVLGWVRTDHAVKKLTADWFFTQYCEEAQCFWGISWVWSGQSSTVREAYSGSTVEKERKPLLPSSVKGRELLLPYSFPCWSGNTGITASPDCSQGTLNASRNLSMGLLYKFKLGWGW